MSTMSRHCGTQPWPGPPSWPTMPCHPLSRLYLTLAMRLDCCSSSVMSFTPFILILYLSTCRNMHLRRRSRFMSLLLSQINSTICDTSLHVTALEASFVEAAGASLDASTKLLGLSNL